MRRLVHCHDYKCLPEVTDFECRVSADPLTPDPLTPGQASLCRWDGSPAAGLIVQLIDIEAKICKVGNFLLTNTATYSFKSGSRGVSTRIQASNCFKLAFLRSRFSP